MSPRSSRRALLKAAGGMAGATFALRQIAHADQTPPAPGGAALPDLPRPPRLSDAALQDLLEAVLPRHGAPALAAAIVGAEGLRFQAAAGVRIAGLAARVSTDDPWHLGSDTKAMTAALYGRLVDQGQAKWGARAPELFPDLADALDKAWVDTTIEQLLSHRAGLRDVGPPWLIARQFDKRPLRDQRTEAVREWLSKPPALPAGRFAYANIGYLIAGAAIERIVDMPWEDAIRKLLFAPLGMAATGFGVPKGDVPRGHSRNLFGRYQPTLTDNPAALGPAGTAHMPLADWARFCTLFLDPAQRLLSADSLRTLITPQGRMPDGEAYALGWAVLDLPDLGTTLTHDGSNSLWYAQAMLFADRRLGLLLTCNAGDKSAISSISAVRDSLRGALLAEPA